MILSAYGKNTEELLKPTNASSVEEAESEDPTSEVSEVVKKLFSGQGARCG